MGRQEAGHGVHGKHGGMLRWRGVWARDGALVGHVPVVGKENITGGTLSLVGGVPVHALL